MKSLISILNREEKLIEEIYRLDCGMDIFKRDLSMAMRYGFDCDTHRSGIKRIREIIDDLYAEKSKCQEELEICRGEMREYFKELFKEERP